MSGRLGILLTMLNGKRSSRAGGKSGLGANLRNQSAEKVGGDGGFGGGVDGIV